VLKEKTVMKNWKGIVFGVGAIALALTFAVPQAAHAVATMLVQVVNTPSQPVPSQVVNAPSQPVPHINVVGAARIPYESTQQPQGTCSGGVGNCVFQWPAPPSGFRLVVQNVSGWLTLSGATTAPPFAVLQDFDNAQSRSTYWSFTGSLGQPSGVSVQSSFNQTTLAVFDEAPAMVVTANFQGSVGQFMTLSGYLENCAVAGCQFRAH
jgi:hypothetical protein